MTGETASATPLPSTRSPHPSLPRPRGRVREEVAAYVYSRDIGRIWRVAEALEYGIVGIDEGIISTEIAPSAASAMVWS
jgi:hypothetical protein